MMLEDKLFIWKLKHGNKDALGQIYKKYKDYLRTIAGSMLHDTHAAEDVLHDVFVSFAKNMEHIQLKVSLKNYLTTCVINRVRDEFRGKQLNTTDLEITEPISSNSKRPEEVVISNEISRILFDALAAIPFEQREVIILHEKGGVKFREIAKIQETTVSTVHGRYRCGLKKLRTILNGSLNK